MVIKVTLQKLNQLVDVHRLLHHSEFLLQASVFSRFLKSKEPISIFMHSKQRVVDSRPPLDIRLTEYLAFCNDCLRFVSHLLLQQVHSLLLFVQALKLGGFGLLLLPADLFIFLGLLDVSILQLSEENSELFSVIEVLSIHKQHRVSNLHGSLALRLSIRLDYLFQKLLV